MRGTAEGGDADAAGGREHVSGSLSAYRIEYTPPGTWDLMPVLHRHAPDKSPCWRPESVRLSEPAARVTPPGPLVTSCSSIVDKGNFNSGRGGVGGW